MASIRQLTPFISVSEQLTPADVAVAASEGFRTIINNRPDHESEDQPASAALAERCAELGIAYHDLPVVPGQVTDEQVDAFAGLLETSQGPVLAFCRTGTRSTTLWALSEARHLEPPAVIKAAAAAGYDISGLTERLTNRRRAAGSEEAGTGAPRHDVVIVGGGAAGLAAAASLLRRRPSLDIVVIEPRNEHYYQPGWTLVGAGVFERNQTERAMASVMPASVRWVKAAAAAFDPGRNQVVLEDGERIGYRALVVAPGLKLDWEAVAGLSETLGRNGVTSNYRFDMAPYTWELVQELKGGTALFTQPPMPIKCAGAPQKAMYLSCDHWRRSGVLDGIDVEFNLAGAALFGVETFVPPLTGYVERYGAKLAFNSNLVAVDGAARKAVFEVTADDGSKQRVDKSFDMLHVCPPQCAPDFIRESALANDAGWVDVDSETMRHTRYGNVFALGDVASTPNAKTAAAVRKQAPVVAENLLAMLDDQPATALYDGYGACPLTVERGKVVMAEFGYGGKLLPTFPLDPAVPRRSMWWLKKSWMPWIYFDLMLKGREWLVKPKRLAHAPAAHEVSASMNDRAGSSKQ